MNTCYKDNWDETFERFEQWWACAPTDRPLMSVGAPRDVPLSDFPKPTDPGPPAKYLDLDYLIRQHRWAFDHAAYLAETIPVASANLGPGSLALYLGSEPVFAPSTVWFRPCIADLETSPLPVLNPDNRWFRVNLDLIRGLRQDAGEDYYVGIPDIIESVDILSAMRDPMTFVYDLMDRPAQCHRWLRRINDLYHPHYDAFYDIVKDDRGASMFTAFLLWGPGKTCKVQCDFAALMSPALFDEFYVPYVTAQIAKLDRVLYHLDGPDAIVHVDSLLKIKGLRAIQWVSGAGKPPNDDERWFQLYEKILAGGKALQISVSAERVEAIIRRLGSRGLYLLTGVKSEREARDLIALAKRASQGPRRRPARQP